MAFLWLPLAADALTKKKTMTKTTLKKKRTATTAGGTKKKKPTSLTGGLFGSNQYLYEKESQVIEYMGDEDTDFKESRMARIVQFYSPFCVSFNSVMD